MKKVYSKPTIKTKEIRHEGMIAVSGSYHDPYDPIIPFPGKGCNCGCGPECCGSRADCKGNGIGGCRHKSVNMFDLETE